MHRKKFGFAAMLMLAALLLSACSTTPSTKEVTLIGTDIAWNLDTIEAQAGQTLEITVRNEGVLDHDFVIEAFDVDILLSPGAEQTVTIVPDQAMVIDYICSIPGHEEAGMVGQIIVTE
jgi:uncharacterized cupredoxin-like copper-binding protein